MNFLLVTSFSEPVSAQKPPSEEPRSTSENLPPIDLKSIQISQNSQSTSQKKDSDTISIKTEEEVISILKPEKTTTESIVSSKISRKNAPKDDDEVRFHRSYQVTETTYTTRNSDETDRRKPENVEKTVESKNDRSVQDKSEKIEKKVPEKLSKPQKTETTKSKERAKWADQGNTTLKREKSIEKSTRQGKIDKSIEKLIDKSIDNTEKLSSQKPKIDMAKGELRKFDVDINEIPIRFEGPMVNKSRINTSRIGWFLNISKFPLFYSNISSHKPLNNKSIRR